MRVARCTGRASFGPLRPPSAPSARPSLMHLRPARFGPLGPIPNGRSDLQQLLPLWRGQGRQGRLGGGDPNTAAARRCHTLLARPAPRPTKDALLALLAALPAVWKVCWQIWVIRMQQREGSGQGGPPERAGRRAPRPRPDLTTPPDHLFQSALQAAAWGPVGPRPVPTWATRGQGAGRGAVTPAVQCSASGRPSRESARGKLRLSFSSAYPLPGDRALAGGGGGCCPGAFEIKSPSLPPTPGPPRRPARARALTGSHVPPAPPRALPPAATQLFPFRWS